MTTPVEPLPDLVAPARYADLMGGRQMTPAILAAASAAVRNACGWHIAPVITQTLILDGPGGTALVLPTGHLVDLTAVVVRGVLLDPLAVEWSADGIVRGNWPARFRSIQVTMQHGYDDTPADLAAIVCSIAARHALTPTGAIREQAGSNSISPSLVAPNVAGGIVVMQHELDALAPFRL